MAPQGIDEKYVSLRHYLDWSVRDEDRISQLRSILMPYAKVFIEDFYAEIVRYPAISRVITGGDRQIARLHQSLLRWVDELLAGHYDLAYIERRWKIGYRHVEIGLDQTYVHVALARLRMQMQSILLVELKNQPDQLGECLITLNKLLDLDLALLSTAYETELQQLK